MSCTRPLIGFPTGKLTANGKPEYKILKTIPIADLEATLNANPDAILIPCGKCIDCRLDYSRRWADRMMLELQTQKKAIFLTLTYSRHTIHPATWIEAVPDPTAFFPSTPNELWSDGRYLIPEYCTLSKRDLQLFMKRLRKEFPEVKLRYYAAGEYGDKTLRPHYHLIVYGLSIDDFLTCSRGTFCRDCSVSDDKYKKCKKSLVKVPAGKNELGDQYYTSPLLERIWKNGNVLFSDVSWKTCAYVARYVTKKYGGDYAVDYMVRNCEPEFSLQSRRPGIGRVYFDQHPECLDYDSIHLATLEGGVKMNVPSYFLRIAELTEPEKVAIIKETRKEASMESMKLKLENTSLKQLDYLDTKEQIKIESVKRLKRKL